MSYLEGWVEPDLVGVQVAALTEAVPVVTRHTHHLPHLQVYLVGTLSFVGQQSNPPNKEN